MATSINRSIPTSDREISMGVVLGIVVGIVAIGLFLMYGFPIL